MGSEMCIRDRPAPSSREPARARARQAVCEVVASACAGPAALLRAFEAFAPLAALDESDFLRALDEGAPAAAARCAARARDGGGAGRSDEECSSSSSSEGESDDATRSDDEGSAGSDGGARVASVPVERALFAACTPWRGRSGATVAELHARAVALDALGARARTLAVADVSAGLLLVRTARARDALASRADRLCDAVCGLVSKRLASRALRLSAQFASLHATLTQDAPDAEAVAAMGAQLDTYPETVIALEARVGADVLDNVALLDGVRRALSDEALVAVVALSRWPERLAAAHDDAALRLERARARAKAELVDERLAFADELDAAQAEFSASIARLGGAECNIDETAPVALAFAARVADARARARVIASRESIFGWAQTDWGRLDELSAALEPFAAMWHAANEFAKAYPVWFDGPLLNVSAALVEEGVVACEREMARATTALAGCAPPLRVVDELNKRLGETRAVLPLIGALLNPGMRERHWSALTAAAGVIRAPSAMATLRALVDAGLLDHLPLIEEVSLVASKEHALERALDKMVSEWAGVAFALAEHRASGIAMLAQLEPVQASARRAARRLSLIHI